MTKKRFDRGFTLAEILLVVAILGLLVSVAMPRLSGRTHEARVQAARLQIENIGAALDAFEFDNGRYPSTHEALESLRRAPAGLANWRGPYLRKDVPLDPWKQPYMYVFPGSHTADFDLSSLGRDGRNGTDDDVTNW